MIFSVLRSTYNDASGGTMPTLEDMSFAYPNTFVVKVKATFPNRVDIHVALDSNKEAVGRYLWEIASTRIDAAWVVKAFMNHNQGEARRLRLHAQSIVDAHELYKEWCMIHGLWHGQTGAYRKS